MLSLRIALIRGHLSMDKHQYQMPTDAGHDIARALTWRDTRIGTLDIISTLELLLCDCLVLKN